MVLILNIMIEKIKNILYLYKRGWRKDKKGWYRYEDVDVPYGTWYKYPPRYMTKDNITLSEAIKLSKLYDPSCKEVINRF
jgi:hypothetical protein